ncbi:hypothetical protein JHK87_017000 [Glycine soja]|nr:hypothetical protein JHK87_017000 [Glycine soja]
MLVGDGLRNTIITSARSVQDGYTTYSSATAGCRCVATFRVIENHTAITGCCGYGNATAIWIDGLHFIARDITFQNTVGPHKQLPEFAQDTLYYGEYQNYGPGASTRNRVKWPGFHVITSPAEASQFTVARLLAGPTWLASATVPFTSGL